MLRDAAVASASPVSYHPHFTSAQRPQKNQHTLTASSVLASLSSSARQNAPDT
jgi:hypothetical protein